MGVWIHLETGVLFLVCERVGGDLPKQMDLWMLLEQMTVRRNKILG